MQRHDIIKRIFIRSSYLASTITMRAVRYNRFLLCSHDMPPLTSCSPLRIVLRRFLQRIKRRLELFLADRPHRHTSRVMYRAPDPVPQSPVPQVALLCSLPLLLPHFNPLFLCISHCIYRHIILTHVHSPRSGMGSGFLLRVHAPSHCTTT